MNETYGFGPLEKKKKSDCEGNIFAVSITVHINRGQLQHNSLRILFRNKNSENKIHIVANAEMKKKYILFLLRM